MCSFFPNTLKISEIVVFKFKQEASMNTGQHFTGTRPAYTIIRRMNELQQPSTLHKKTKKN